MTRSKFVINLIILVIATLILAGILWGILGGAQGFSFYGLATCALVALPVLAYLLVKRANILSQSRWPILLVTTLTIMLALVQIGYWLAFFNLDLQALPLAIGRAMMPPTVMQILAWSPLVLSLFLAWFIARALRTDH